MEVFLMASAVVVAIAGVAGWVRGRGRPTKRSTSEGAHPVAAESEAPIAERLLARETLDDRDGDLTVMMRRQG